MGIGRHVRGSGLSTHRTLVGVLSRGGLIHISGRGTAGTATGVMVCFPTSSCSLRPGNIASGFPRVCKKGFMVGNSKTNGAHLLVGGPVKASRSAATPLLAVGRAGDPTGVGGSGVLTAIIRGTTGNDFDMGIKSIGRLSING